MSLFQVWFRWLCLNFVFSTLALCMALRAGLLGDDLAHWFAPAAKAHGLKLIFLGERAIHVPGMGSASAHRVVDAFWAALIGQGWAFWLVVALSLAAGLIVSTLVERGLGKVRGA